MAGRCWLYRRCGATHDRPFHRRRSATLAKTLRKSARSPAGPTHCGPKSPSDASTLMSRLSDRFTRVFTRCVLRRRRRTVRWTLVGRYGTVTSLHIPKKDEAGAGKIFVEYLQMDQAECTTAHRARCRSATPSSTLCMPRPTTCACASHGRPSPHTASPGSPKGPPVLSRRWYLVPAASDLTPALR